MAEVVKVGVRDDRVGSNTKALSKVLTKICNRYRAAGHVDRDDAPAKLALSALAALKDRSKTLALSQVPDSIFDRDRQHLVGYHQRLEVSLRDANDAGPLP